ncbi:unnamed protein product [Paramecium octaurelia]|uniref:Uncharacterized protein n=1 Tax=Paramecium octaurelia TaxID=43137 RepID=A0A8S1X2T3_PAROT|nr:unnamed protein product [Paramecium octaurelia]
MKRILLSLISSHIDSQFYIYKVDYIKYKKINQINLRVKIKQLRQQCQLCSLLNQDQNRQYSSFDYLLLMRQQFENKYYYTFIVLYIKLLCMIRNSKLVEMWEFELIRRVKGKEQRIEKNTEDRGRRQEMQI